MFNYLFKKLSYFYIFFLKQRQLAAVILSVVFHGKEAIEVCRNDNLNIIKCLLMTAGRRKFKAKLIEVTLDDSRLAREIFNFIFGNMAGLTTFRNATAAAVGGFAYLQFKLLQWKEGREAMERDEAYNTLRVAYVARRITASAPAPAAEAAERAMYPAIMSVVHGSKRKKNEVASCIIRYTGFLLLHRAPDVVWPRFTRYFEFFILLYIITCYVFVFLVQKRVLRLQHWPESWHRKRM